MKLPYMQVYIADWIKDTRILTIEQRGAWWDILCILWESPTRGKKTQNLADWSQSLGATEQHIEYLLREIQRKKVGGVTFRNGYVTVMSRRMVREEKSRQLTNIRVMRHRNKVQVRDKKEDNANVTPEKLDVRCYKQKQHIYSFAKPTAPEVQAYAKTIGYFLDGHRFIDFYDSKGWVVGRSPMKDWKAAVRTWKASQINGQAAPRVSDKERWIKSGKSSCHTARIEDRAGKPVCSECKEIVTSVSW